MTTTLLEKYGYTTKLYEKLDNIRPDSSDPKRDAWIFIFVFNRSVDDYAKMSGKPPKLIRNQIRSITYRLESAKYYDSLYQPKFIRAFQLLPHGEGSKRVTEGLLHRMEEFRHILSDSEAKIWDCIFRDGMTVADAAKHLSFSFTHTRTLYRRVKRLWIRYADDLDISCPFYTRAFLSLLPNYNKGE